MFFENFVSYFRCYPKFCAFVCCCMNCKQNKLQQTWQIFVNNITRPRQYFSNVTLIQRKYGMVLEELRKFVYVFLYETIQLWNNTVLAIIRIQEVHVTGYCFSFTLKSILYYLSTWNKNVAEVSMKYEISI